MYTYKFMLFPVAQAQHRCTRLVHHSSQLNRQCWHQRNKSTHTYSHMLMYACRGSKYTNLGYGNTCCNFYLRKSPTLYLLIGPHMHSKKGACMHKQAGNLFLRLWPTYPSLVVQIWTAIQMRIPLVGNQQ